MPVLALAWLALAVGPQLDPIVGETVGRTEQRVLPSGRHLGAIADLWLPNVVSMQVGGAGIDLFDPLYLSVHGRAWTQMHYRLGMLDITDPARPGHALLDVPQDAWQRLQLQSLWSSQPGFTWDLALPAGAPAGAWLGLRAGRPLRGGVWFPRHIFDRDPGFAWGVPTERRALDPARELVGSLSLRPSWGPMRLSVEHLDHRHTYPTLAAVPDQASRTTLLAWQSVQLPGSWPLTLSLGWQRRQRSHAGAQDRLPLGLTQATAGQAALLQLHTQGPLQGLGQLDLAVGGGWRTDTARPHDPGPQVLDILDQWLWLGRPAPRESLRRWRGDLRASLQLDALPLQLQVVGMLATRRRQQTVGGGRQVETYQGRPIRELRYDPPQTGSTWLRSARLEASWAPQLANLSLQVLAALDHGGLVSRGGAELQYVSPAGGATARLPLGDGEIYLLLRREPEVLTAQVGDFLDPEGPSGSVYQRRDPDADPRASTAPLGPRLRRSGGSSQGLGAGVRRPSSNQLALGGRSPAFGPFRFSASAVGRWVLNRFSVALDSPGGWQPQALRDPGGDGRGEVPAPGGGQALTAYARDPNTWGSERYALRNADDVPFYGGIELNLVSEPGRRWFVNLGGAAYLSSGAAPFGNGPDRNDPGIVDPASADRNQAIHALGRYDHDRAFSLKLMAGGLLLPGLSLSTTARYRDGRPFSRMLVATDLPQGPTAIMAVPRGKPRDTFHMGWDVRVRYELPLRPVYLALLGDVFNLLGSATEILEDVRTGPSFRQALEGVPGRAVLLSLEMGWLDADAQQRARDPYLGGTF